MHSFVLLFCSQGYSQNMSLSGNHNSQDTLNFGFFYSSVDFLDQIESNIQNIISLSPVQFCPVLYYLVLSSTYYFANQTDPRSSYN
jgi:hypothetical protein